MDINKGKKKNPKKTTRSARRLDSCRRRPWVSVLLTLLGSSFSQPNNHLLFV
jgi:hypothetical protein